MDQCYTAAKANPVRFLLGRTEVDIFRTLLICVASSSTDKEASYCGKYMFMALHYYNICTFVHVRPNDQGFSCIGPRA